jgi:hypothetical protein
MKDLTQWKKYLCEFITIAGWLLNKKKINETQQAAYFWHGIHSGLRGIIEQRLSAKNPLHDITQVFPMTDVINTAQALLERNEFDHDLMDSDSEESSDESSESDSEDNSLEHSDSESESEVDHNKSPHKKKSHKKKAKSYKAKSSKEDHTKKQTSKDTSYTQQKNSQEEVENLIKQLGKTSVNNPQYALSYYKAVKLDSLAAKCLRPPQVGGYSPTSGGPRTSSYPNSIPLGSRNSLLCYGCGESGHGLRDCPVINKLLKAGVIIKDVDGRIKKKDGQPIYRQKGESIVQAIGKTTQRSPRAQSHFITMSQTLSDYYQSEQDDDSDFESIHVMAADKEFKKPISSKKVVFDGVELPSKHYSKPTPGHTHQYNSFNKNKV